MNLRTGFTDVIDTNHCQYRSQIVTNTLRPHLIHTTFQTFLTSSHLKKRGVRPKGHFSTHFRMFRTFSTFFILFLKLFLLFSSFFLYFFNFFELWNVFFILFQTYSNFFIFLKLYRTKLTIFNFE